MDFSLEANIKNLIGNSNNLEDISFNLLLNSTATRVGQVDHKISRIALKSFSSFLGPKNMQKTYILLFRNMD